MDAHTCSEHCPALRINNRNCSTGHGDPHVAVNEQGQDMGGLAGTVKYLHRREVPVIHHRSPVFPEEHVLAHPGVVLHEFHAFAAIQLVLARVVGVPGPCRAAKLHKNPAVA